MYIKILSPFIKDYLTVFSIVLSVFASVMSSFMLVMCYSEIMDQFDVSLQDFHWRTFLFFTAFSVGLLFFGTAIQKIGVHRQFYMGMTMFMMAVLGSALAPYWSIFLAFQFFHGLSDAMMVSAMPVLITMHIARERFGWAFGLQSSILSLATLLGPLVGHLVSFYGGWKAVFYTLFCITACALWLSSITLAPLKKKNKSLLPLPYLSTISLFGLFISFHSYIKNTTNTYINLFLLILCFVIFLGQELKGKTKLIPQQIWKNKSFLLCAVFAFVISIIGNLLYFFVPGYFQNSLGMSKINLGLIITANASIPFLLATYFGKQADLNPHRIFLAGLLIYGSTFAIFNIFREHFQLWNVALLYMSTGLASALFSPSQMKLTILTIPSDQTGSYMGFYYFLQFSAGSMATSVFILLNTIGASSHEITHQDFHSIMLFSAISVSLLLVFGTLRTLRKATS